VKGEVKDIEELLTEMSGDTGVEMNLALDYI
jgi:hypothetical protein